MISRFYKIHRDFGMNGLLRTILLLVGMISMSAISLIYWKRLENVLTLLAISILGFILKNKIANLAGYITKIFNVMFFVYGIVLFLGDKIDLSVYWKLFIITETTVLAFTLQFWALSDPLVYKIQDESSSEA